MAMVIIMASLINTAMINEGGPRVNRLLPRPSKVVYVVGLDARLPHCCHGWLQPPRRP
jgi:hypothetical protein